MLNVNSCIELCEFTLSCANLRIYIDCAHTVELELSEAKSNVVAHICDMSQIYMRYITNIYAIYRKYICDISPGKSNENVKNETIQEQLGGNFPMSPSQLPGMVSFSIIIF